MNYRIFLNPWYQVGPNAVAPVIEKYLDDGISHRTYFPTNAQGKPNSPWVLSVAWGDNWTGIDTDSDIIDVFLTGVPSDIDTEEKLENYAKSRKWSDLVGQDKTKIKKLLRDNGVSTSEIVNSTSWWEIFNLCVTYLDALNVRL